MSVPGTEDPYYVAFGPKSNCTLEVCPISHSVYRYRPSLAANVTFIAIYATIMLVHVLLGIRWKTWWFMGCMIAGCLDEIVGYGGRVMLWYNPFNFAGFMTQIVCITTGPVFYCAAIYVTLARTITYLSPSTARFPPKYLYWVFIFSDLVSLVLQGTGGGMSTSSSGTSQVAVNIALTGLSLQVFTLVIFTGLFADYLIRFSYQPEAKTLLDTRMKTFLACISLAIILTLARCAYRVDELSSGYSGPLVANEGLFIGLEGVLIVISTLLLCVGSPGFAFPNTNEKEPLSGGESGHGREMEMK